MATTEFSTEQEEMWRTFFDDNHADLVIVAETLLRCHLSPERVPSTVTAMKGGAMDFLTKPIDETALLACIEKAFEQDRKRRVAAFERQILLARYQSLTPREQQVLPMLVSGLLNKQAAGELGITEYTVQIHRGHIMQKMKADSFATLVKIAGKLNLESSKAS
jgi:FixJ family two-component response regulator